MVSVQKRGGVRVASSDRTVPELVVLVIVGVVLIDHSVLGVKASICKTKAEMKLEEMRQSIKPENSLSGARIGRTEEHGPHGSYQT